MSLQARVRQLETSSRTRSAPAALTVPHVMHFALSADYLGVALYPRQATLLKVMFLRPDLFTPYDEAVLAEWTAGFALHEATDGSVEYRGSYGMVADVADRIDRCQAQGRGWFREVVLVLGRRGSKGFLGAVAGAYILWQLLATGDPTRHYGLPRGKQLHVLVFAGKHEQAKVNQYRDLADVICAAPCFAPYIAARTTSALQLFSPAQVAAGCTDPDRAAIVVTALEATPLSGRGTASPMLYFDEMAHMVAGGSNRPAEEVFSAAMPASAQFRRDAFVFQASSPWQQQGKFYENYRRGLAVNPLTRGPQDPDILVVQLPSGDLYRDWEATGGGKLAAWSGGPPLPRQHRAVFDESDTGAVLRRADPANYAVEYLAQWQTSVAAYLRAEDVDALFAPWRDRRLEMASRGISAHRYVAHGDPSVSGANFGFVVAHPETDETGQRHVIVDLLQVWRPADFAHHTIDYEVVVRDLEEIIRRFPIQAMSFDQFNAAGLLGQLRSFVRTESNLVARPMLDERTATAARNHREAETLKTALGRRLVHAPYHDLAEAELRNLEVRNGKVDHPTRGPVQTADLADCLMAVTAVLLGDHLGDDLHSALSAQRLSASRPGSLSGGAVDPAHAALSAFSRASHRHRGEARGPARGGRFWPK